MKPVSPEEFSASLGAYLPRKVTAVAVGVSGGPDSMALAWLLSQWSKKSGVQIHALSVDHGLRKESAAEAKKVSKSIAGWPNTKHSVLRWTGKKPKTGVMEAARAVRYRLMGAYCRKYKIKYLLLAHHQDDQAETFLFRLAKGSGLDGLASIRPVQALDEGISLLRPLLSIPKQRLELTCKSQKISYIKDPSNESARFARPRLRKALKEEGMSAKRLATTAARLERAQRALEEIANKGFKVSAQGIDSRRIVLSHAKWAKMPEEIRFRILLKAIKALRPGEDYLPRMEKIENLFQDLCRDIPFRKRTLGGLIFACVERKGGAVIVIEKEA